MNDRRDRLRLDPDPLYVPPEEVESRRGSMRWTILAVLLVIGAVVLVSLAAERTRAAEPATSMQGVISHVGPGFPSDYLALPINDSRRPLTVRVCGPADCVVLTQTDYGPSQTVRPDRIADVAPVVFERICGVPASAGLCQGSWTIAKRPLQPIATLQPHVTLPPTDTAP